MFISWLGNSTFLIKTSLGKRILIDPINKFHSCNINSLKPNLLTLSSTTFKCNCLSSLDSSTTVINEPTIFKNDIATILGFKTYCDDINGLKRGQNIIYKYIVDDLVLCHLGYLGHILNSSLIAEISNCDILFLPIGGNITLNGKSAFSLLKKINPTYVIPMNYKFNTDSFLFDSSHSFLKLSKNFNSTPIASFYISKNEVKKETNKNNLILLIPNNPNTI